MIWFSQYPDHFSPILYFLLLWSPLLFPRPGRRHSPSGHYHGCLTLIFGILRKKLLWPPLSHKALNPIECLLRTNMEKNKVNSVSSLPLQQFHTSRVVNEAWALLDWLGLVSRRALWHLVSFATSSQRSDVDTSYWLSKLNTLPDKQRFPLSFFQRPYDRNG